MNKIAFFTSNMSNFGGTQRVVTLLANQLVNEGYEVHIFSLGLGFNSSFFELDKSVMLVSIDYDYKILNFCKILKKVNALIKHYSINTVLGIGVYNSLLLPILNVERRIACEHSAFLMPSIKVRILRAVLYRFCDYVISLTNSDYLKLKKINSRTLVIPNPLPFVGNSSMQKDNTIVAIGSLVKGKGYDRMLNIWKLIEMNNLDYKLHIYGTGPEEEYLKAFQKSLNLKNVHFCGATKDVRSVLEKARLLIHTSYFEGFSLVLLEALACSTPIVTFDVEIGPREIVNNNINGFLIPNESVDLFVEKVLLLINDEETYKRIRTNCKDSISRFSMDNVIKKWKEIL